MKKFLMILAACILAMFTLMACESTDDIQEQLNEQVKSTDMADWLEVAESNSAKECHLLVVAEKCLKVGRDNPDATLAIVDALSSNPATTERVMNMIEKSVASIENY